MDDVLDIEMWIQYAQDDYDGAVATSAANHPYSPRHACYLCQQSAEKILKAYLIAQSGTRAKEHNLVVLVNQCKRYSSDFCILDVACSTLNVHVTTTRYPSMINLTVSDMRQALKCALEILEFTKSKILSRLL